MNKFAKLIEYVINEDEAKANNLFHEIVVEKSRAIYESLMDDDANEFGGDSADTFAAKISAEEEGMTEADDEMGPEMSPEMGAGDEMAGGEYSDEMGITDLDGEMEAPEEELEDRVVNLEDQLDELMGEFEAMMGGDEMGTGDEMGMEPGMDDEMSMGGDEMGMEMEPEMEESRPQPRSRMRFEGDESDEDAVTEDDETTELDENVALTKVSKGIANKSEEAGVNKKTINNDNAGKKGLGGNANPVNFTSNEEKGSSKVSYKAGDSTTEPRESKVSKGIANKSEEAGTDKQSLAKARK